MSATPEPIRDMLLYGETVTWWGRPPQGLRLFWRDVLLVPFSLVWGGFPLLWESDAIMTPDLPLFFLAFEAIFVVLGLYFMIGRHLLDAWVRARTHYALTNRRILIVRDGVWSGVTAFALDRCPEVALSWSGRERGTIVFGSGVEPSGFRLRGALTGNPIQVFTLWLPGLYPIPQFFAVRDAKRVYGWIQDAIARAEKRGATAW